MATTQLTGRQFKDGDIRRVELDTSTAGQAVIAKIIASTGITMTQTGVDSGTGDVTLSINSATVRGLISGAGVIGYDNTTGVISISTASTSVSGILTSTDWNLFNNKAALSAGTIGYLPKRTSAGGLGDSMVFDNGTTLAIGTNTNIDSFSRVFIYGGSSGANVDIRGIPGTQTDQAIIDLQASDYATTFISTYLKHYGSTAVGTVMGITAANLGELNFQGSAGLIRTIYNSPIIVGVNNAEVARFISTGFTTTLSIVGKTESLSDNSTKVATTAFVKGQGYATANTETLASVTGRGNTTLTNIGIGTLGSTLNAPIHIASDTALTGTHIVAILGDTSTGFSGSNDANAAYLIEQRGTTYGINGVNSIVTYPGARFGLQKEGSWNTVGVNAAFTIQLSSGGSSTTLPTIVERLRLSSTGILTIGNKILIGSGSFLTNSYFRIGQGSATHIQGNIQNTSAGTTASSDWVATADTGTDTANFINMGINSSTNADSSWTMGGALDGYLFTNGGHQVIGTQTAGKTLKFFTGGTLAANLRVTIQDNALVTAAGVNILVGTALPSRHTASSTYPGIFVGNGSNSSVIGETTSGFKGLALLANIVRDTTANWVAQDTTQPAWRLSMNYETAQTDFFQISRAASGQASTITEANLFYIKGSTGNVSIGAGNTPLGRLDIGGPGGVIFSGINLDPASYTMPVGFATSAKMLIGWNRQAGFGEFDFISNRGAGTVGGFTFYDYTNAGVLNPLLSLRGDGSASITGTLTVSGNTTINGNLGVGVAASDRFDVAGTSASFPGRMIYGDAAGFYPLLRFHKWSGSASTYFGARIRMIGIGSSDASISFDTSAAANIGSETWVSRFYIDNANGNTGFGTITPQNVVSLRANAAMSIDMITPTITSLTTATTGGTITTGTYYYKISASDGLGFTILGSELSIAVPATTTTNIVTLAWPAVAGAISYRIWKGTATNAQTGYFTSSTPSFIDTGAALTAASVPTATTSYVTKVNGAGSSWFNGGSLLIGDTNSPSPVWSNPLVIGKNGTDKVIISYLASSTNGATVGAHNSVLGAWAKLNVGGSSLAFLIQESPKMVLDLNGFLGVGSLVPVVTMTVAAPFAKTDTTQRWSTFLGSNDAANPFGIAMGVTGAALLANRTFTIQTADWALTNGGTLALNPQGGNLQMWANTTASTLTPWTLSLGGQFGGNVAGHVNNLKLILYNDGILANNMGFGISNGLMELHSGAGADIGLFTNNGGSLVMKMTTAGNASIPTGSLIIGSTAVPTAKLDVRGDVVINSALNTPNLWINTTGTGDLLALNKSAVALLRVDNAGRIVMSGSGTGANLLVGGAIQTLAGSTVTAQGDGQVSIYPVATTRSMTQGAALTFVLPANSDGTNPWEQARIIAVADNANNGDANGRIYIQTRSNQGVPGWTWINNLMMSASGLASFIGSVTAPLLAIGSNGISIQSWEKISSQSAAGTAAGIGVRSGAKSLYLFNDGTTIKLDAYDYSTSTALNFSIGGNGGTITIAGTLSISGNTTSSGTITATNHIGPGTGLTGTASALSIGGNAATATNSTQWNGQSYIASQIGTVQYAMVYEASTLSWKFTTATAFQTWLGLSGYAATNQSFFIGTTAMTINRASAAQTLTGVSIDGNAATVTNGVYTTTFNTLGDARYLQLTGGTLSGSITATNHIGPGTGLTGTASALNIGGNAATVTSITSSQVTTALGFTPYNATNPAGYITAAQTYFIGTTSLALNRTSAAQTLTGISIDGNAATVTNGVYTTTFNGLGDARYLQLTGGTLSGTITATNHIGPGTGLTGTASALSIGGNAATVTNGVYTTGSYSNPAWITALASNKVTTAATTSGGTGTNPNYWTKVATVTPTADFADGSIILNFVSNGGAWQTATVSFAYRQNQSASTPPTQLSVSILAMDGGAAIFADDSFRFISAGYNAVCEIWVKKTNAFGAINVYEISSKTSDVITYLSAQVWTATLPTATYVAVSNGLSYAGVAIIHATNFNTLGPTLASGSWNINAATVTNGVYTTTFNTLGDARYLQLTGGTLSGTITATNHIGPGTGLTGTASALNIGGNAATVTNGVYTTTFNTLGDARYQLLENQRLSTTNNVTFAVITASGFTGPGTGLTGTAGSLNIGGNAATVTNGVYTTTFNGLGDARYLQLTGGTLSGTITATNHIGPGTGLTGTASSLSIGGNAATATTATNSTQLGGISLDILIAGLKAPTNITGGGVISVTSGAVKWTTRFIVISNGNGSHTTTSGYYDIAMPAVGAVITGVGGSANVTVTSNGVPLSTWQALYYIHVPNTTNTSLDANFRVAAYTSTLVVPYNWILICINNVDNASWNFASGISLKDNSSYNTGTYSDTLVPNSTLWNNQPYTASQIGTVQYAMVYEASSTSWKFTTASAFQTWLGLSNYALVGQSFFIGTTAMTINRASAAQTLTGISIDGNAGTVTNGVYTTTFNTLGDARYLQLTGGTLSGTITATNHIGPGTGLTGTASALSIGGNATTVTNGVYTTTFNGLGDARYLQLIGGTVTGRLIVNTPSTTGSQIVLTNSSNVNTGFGIFKYQDNTTDLTSNMLYNGTNWAMTGTATSGNLLQLDGVLGVYWYATNNGFTTVTPWNVANAVQLWDASGIWKTAVNTAGTVTAANHVGPGTGLTGTASGLSIGGNAATVTSITSGQVTTALGFTPYNATNPAGYITAAQTHFVGTTSIALNRASAAQTLTGVSIDGNAATVTNGVYTTTYNTLGDARYLQLTGGTLSGTITATNFIGPGTGLTGTASSLSIGGNAATATSIAWTGISGKPTTIATYGITDGINRVVISDFNSVLTNSIIESTTATPTNGPVNNWLVGYQFLINQNSSYLTQFVFDIAGNSYVRTKAAGAFGAWFVNWTSASLTNLNQLTNGPNYITTAAADAKYLQLTGGALSGLLTLNNGLIVNGLEMVVSEAVSYGSRIISSNASADPRVTLYRQTGNGTTFYSSRTIMVNNVLKVQIGNSDSLIGSETWNTALSIFTTGAAEVGGDFGVDVTNTRNLGSAAKTFNNAYANNLLATTAVSGNIVYGTGVSPLIQGMILDLHPESNNVTLPYISNDIAFNRLKGGTITDNRASTQGELDGLVDGSPQYAILASSMPSGGYIMTMDLFTTSTFAYNVNIGISFGNSAWVLQNIQVEVFRMDTSAWVTVGNVTGWSKPMYQASFNTSGYTIGKIRFTMSSPVNSPNWRIAQVWLNYFNSTLLKNVFVGRDGGQIYGSLSLTGNMAASGNVTASGTAFIGTGGNGIQAWEKISAQVASGSVGIAARNGYKAMYMYNDGSTAYSLGAYDYFNNVGLPMTIGGNGSTIKLDGDVTATGGVTALSFTGPGTGLSGLASALSIGGNAGTVSNGVYTTSSFNLGTTSIPLNRTSAAQTLTGINIDGNAGTVTSGVYTTTFNSLGDARYLQLGGGTVTGALTVNNTITSSGMMSLWDGTNTGGITTIQSIVNDKYFTHNGYYNGSSWQSYNSGLGNSNIGRLANGDILFFTNPAPLTSSFTPVLRFKIAYNGVINFPGLAGTGTRMLVADSSGNVSIQTMPTLQNVLINGSTLTQANTINAGTNSLTISAVTQFNITSANLALYTSTTSTNGLNILSIYSRNFANTADTIRIQFSAPQAAADIADLTLSATAIFSNNVIRARFFGCNSGVPNVTYNTAVTTSSIIGSEMSTRHTCTTNSVITAGDVKMCTVTFNNTMPTIPTIVISSANSATALALPYVLNVSTTGYEVWMRGTAASTNYAFNIIAML
jgi:hypothetical protein